MFQRLDGASFCRHERERNRNAFREFRNELKTCKELCVFSVGNPARRACISVARSGQKASTATSREIWSMRRTASARTRGLSTLCQLVQVK